VPLPSGLPYDAVKTTAPAVPFGAIIRPLTNLSSVTRRTYLLLFVFLFLPYSYFNHSDGWNQGSRLAALHAVVIKGTIAIDAYQKTTGDKAFVNGHYYSEKAPAMTVLALPAFSVTVLAQRMLGIDPDSVRAWAVSQWIATTCSVGLVVALGGVAFFALLRTRMSDAHALLATVGVWLGTFAMPYASALFSHAGTAGLMAIALWAVLDPRRSARRDYVAGLCAGLAIASEYPAAIGAGCLAVYVWTQDRNRASRLLLAFLPGLALIAMNNYLITGSPFQLAYGSNENFPTEGAAHGFGHGAPSLTAALGVLVGEYRGLFFWNPVLLMAIPGWMVLVRMDRAFAMLIATTAALCLLQVASFHNPHGGFAVGPRYLLPAIPILGLAAAFGIARFPKTGAALAAVSVGLMALVTSIGISPAEDLMTPLRDYYIYRLVHGALANNLGLLLGLTRTGSAALLAVPLGILGWQLLRDVRSARIPPG